MHLISYALNHNRAFVFVFSGLLFCLNGNATTANSCHGLFSNSSVPYYRSLEIKIEHGIPNEIRPLLAQVVREFSDSLPSTLRDKMPKETIIFKRSNPSDFNWGDSADPINSTIHLTTASFRLSTTSFKALVIHELTHLIVFRSFRMNSGMSLLDFVKSKGPSHEVSVTMVNSHEPLAELLCDLMGVALTKDPKAYSNLLREFLIYWPLEVSQKYRTDSLDPIMGQRDFSVKTTSQEWEKFNPQFRRNHNYLNQTRSYIWNHWLLRLPPTTHTLVFEKVLEVLGDLFTSPIGFNSLRWNTNDNVSLVNQKIIEMLEIELEKVFHRDLN